MEISVVMPCLNEAETVATCVRKAVGFFVEHGVDGEVLIADNGSTDGSQELATEAGARIVPVEHKGYGNALFGGIQAARGRYVIMGDADDSYDFTALWPFLEQLRNGADLVMGNRFAGGVAPGAMPPLHRYLGNPVLSFVGRLFFGSKIGDFHCGLRGFRRDRALSLGLQSTGMEFASEMVVKATLADQKIVEVPTTLSPDGRSHPPHLRSWRDGWRHLRFLLLYSPRWLFLIPGIALILLGLIIGIPVGRGPVTVGEVTFDVDTLVGAAAMILIGFHAVTFALLTKVYAMAEGFLPPDRRVRKILRVWNLERGLLVGGVLAVAGLVGLVASVSHWQVHSFGELDPRWSLRLVVPSATALVVSFQIVIVTFFLSILGIRRSRHPETETGDMDGDMDVAEDVAPPAGPSTAEDGERPRISGEQPAPGDPADAASTDEAAADDAADEEHTAAH